MNLSTRLMLLFLFLICLSPGDAYSYEVKKNDIIEYLRSKGYDDVTFDKYGDIVVGISEGGEDFTVYILLKSSKGKTWGIKTMHIAPVPIPRDRADFLIRLANIYNRRKGVFRTTYVRKKDGRYKLVMKSWFPCEYVNDSNKAFMFEEYYTNSFKAVSSQLKYLHSASKCVRNHSAEKMIKSCLEDYELSSGF